MTSLTTPIPAAPPTAWQPGAAPRAAAGAGGITLGDILRVLRERMFLVLGVWLLVSALAVGVTAAVQVYYPLWPAGALVQVVSLQAPDPTDILNTRSSVNETGIERLLLDQSFLAISPPVLDQALQDPEVRSTAWYVEAKAKFESDATKRISDQLKQTIGVNPVRRTSLLSFDCATKVPRDAPILVNTLIDKYIALADKISKDSYRNEQESLQRRITAQKNARDAKYSQMATHLQQFPFVQSMLGNDRTPVDDDVMFFNAMKNDFATQALNFKNQWDLLENLGPESTPITDEIRQQVEDSPLIQDYRKRLSELEENREGLLNRLGPNHREVRDFDRTILETKTRLEGLRQEATNRLLLQLRDEARRSYATAQQTLVRLEELYSEAIARQADQQDKLKTYREMEVEHEGLSEKVDELNKNFELLSSVINRAKTAQITLFAPAIEPKVRSRPNWYVWIPSGVGLGLLLAVGLAMLLEFTDSTVRTPRDVSRHTELAVLGIIPAAEDDEVEIEQIELAVLKQPQSIVAEAFRNLRTSLFFAAPPERQQLIMVTSPSPGEGKSTVAFNLATAIAMSKRRVLLIDANFRKPALRQFFPEARAEGLSNYLIGQYLWDDVISTTSIPGLDVCSAGPLPPNPAELFVGEYLPRLIENARKQYDKIIIDGPPVLLVSDAMVLAGAVDGMILVCRSRSTSRGAVIRARNQIESIGTHILGCVLNAVQTTRSGYFRKQYRAYYEYQLEEGVEAGPQQLTAARTAEPPTIAGETTSGDAPSGGGPANPPKSSDD